MQSFSFKDINVDDETALKGNSEDEVVEKALSRLKADHPDKYEDFQTKMSEEELKGLIRNNIKEE